MRTLGLNLEKTPGTWRKTSVLEKQKNISVKEISHVLLRVLLQAAAAAWSGYQ